MGDKFVITDVYGNAFAIVRVVPDELGLIAFILKAALICFAFTVATGIVVAIVLFSFLWAILKSLFANPILLIPLALLGAGVGYYIQHQVPIHSQVSRLLQGVGIESPEPTPTGPLHEIRYVDMPTILVRAEPKLAAPIVGKLKRGTEVALLGVTSAEGSATWTMLVGPISGWVNIKQLSDAPPVPDVPTQSIASAEPTPTVRTEEPKIVDAETLNVRAEANPDAAIVIQLKKGTSVVFFGETQTAPDGGVWAKITTVAGHEGWVNQKFLR